jgi:hypothetical protein
MEEQLKIPGCPPFSHTMPCTMHHAHIVDEANEPGADVTCTRAMQCARVAARLRTSSWLSHVQLIQRKGKTELQKYNVLATEIHQQHTAWSTSASSTHL